MCRVHPALNEEEMAAEERGCGAPRCRAAFRSTDGTGSMGLVFLITDDNPAHNNQNNHFIDNPFFY